MLDSRLQSFLSSPLAIDRRYLLGLCASIARGTAVRADDDPQRQAPAPAAVGATAVIPIVGVIAHRSDWMMEWFGGVSTQDIDRWVRKAMADPAIGSIVFDVDSPGGSVEGLEETSDLIYGFRGRKPMVAVANKAMFSAAYYIGSAADRVLVAPSAMVGSIGTLAVHTDISRMLDEAGIKETLIYRGRYKAEGAASEPLADEARAEFQRIIDSYYVEFVDAVARNRNVPRETVEADFGQGRTFRAADAVAVGMADAVGTLEDAAATAVSMAGQSGGRDPAIMRRRALHRLPSLPK